MEISSEVWEPGEVQLQASWSNGQVVVWAAGRGAPAEANEELATRLESIGGPSVGWQLHPSVPLPGGLRADAVAIPLKDALGWLVAIGGGNDLAGIGPSVLWLGRAALEGVRLVANGSVVPNVRIANRSESGLIDTTVRWVPALLDATAINALAAAMPGAVVAVGGGNSCATRPSPSSRRLWKRSWPRASSARSCRRSPPERSRPSTSSTPCWRGWTEPRSRPT